MKDETSNVGKDTRKELMIIFSRMAYEEGLISYEVHEKAKAEIQRL